MARLLRAQGATVVAIPTIEIRPPRSNRPLDAALRNLSAYDWLILTSVNGVEAFFARMQRLRIAKSELRGVKIAAIGPATARAVRKHGLRVALVPQEYVAEAVVAALRKRVTGKRVLLARASVARDVIPRALRRAGANVDVVEVYETVVPRGSATHLRRLLASPHQRPDAITFSSSSTARNFIQLIGGQARAKRLLEGITLASIGPVTSATLRELGLRADVEARQYTMKGLATALAKKIAADKG